MQSRGWGGCPAFRWCKTRRPGAENRGKFWRTRVLDGFDVGIIYIYTYIHTYIHIYIYIDSGCNIILFIRHVYHRRKFRSQTSDNMDRWKAEMERVREKRKIRREKSRRERVRRKKMQMREKVRKSRNTVFFQWFVAPKGRNVGSLKRRVRSQLARWEMKNCTPFWREAHFQVKMYKTLGVRTTFGSWDVEKVHFQVKMFKMGADHFWQLRCRKSARRCGVKHISKSKCSKHSGFGPVLEVELSKKCTPLWREAHFEVKMFKTLGFGPLLEVQTSLRFTTLHYTTLHYTKLHYTTLHYTTLRSTTLHYTTSHYTTLHYTPLHYITLYYTIFHYTSLPYTTLHSITLQLQLQLHN